METLLWFPPILPNESLYSVLAFYHLWSPVDAVVLNNADLFGRRFAKSSPDLPAYVGLLAARLPEAAGLTSRRLALEATQICYSTAFVPREDAEEAIGLLIEGSPSLHLFLGVNASVVGRPEHLHFCPECLTEMRERAGRWWWRLDHQLPGVLVCPDHGCALRRCPHRLDAGSDHGFRPAIEENCPEDAEPLVDGVSDATLASLLEVARRSAELLRSGPRFGGYGEITDFYRAGLLAKGMMITPKQLDVGRFLDAFETRLGPTLDALRPVFAKMGSPKAWILEMARKHDQAKHPLQHVLFQMFLDALPDVEPVFGHGPWPCPNPIADHGAGALVITKVDQRRQTYGIVGEFRCACGYVYTHARRYDGRPQAPRYKCFGPLLDPALVRLVKEGATLRGAAAALGVHPRAIARAADRLGLGKDWKVEERAGPRLGRATAPKPERRVAEPKVSRNPGRPRVDWERVDAETLAAIEPIVAELRATVPAISVSLREIERRHKGIGSIYLRRTKLPSTMAYLATVIETVEQFQERRLRTVIATTLADGLPLRVSKIVRAASLRSEIWSERARRILDELP